jgi:hypothetical protein
MWYQIASVFENLIKQTNAMSIGETMSEYIRPVRTQLFNIIIAIHICVSTIASFFFFMVRISTTSLALHVTTWRYRSNEIFFVTRWDVWIIIFYRYKIFLEYTYIYIHTYVCVYMHVYRGKKKITCYIIQISFFHSSFFVVLLEILHCVEVSRIPELVSENDNYWIKNTIVIIIATPH